MSRAQRLDVEDPASVKLQASGLNLNNSVASLSSRKLCSYLCRFCLSVCFFVCVLVERASLKKTLITE